MTKWLMDENQQPYGTQALGRLLPSIRGRGTRGESSDSFLRLVLVNHLLQQRMQIILVLQDGLPQNRQLKKYGDEKQLQRNH